MITITDIIDTERSIRIQGSLDDENRLATNYYLMPESNLIPKETWGKILSTSKFEYDISKITKLKI